LIRAFDETEIKHMTAVSVSIIDLRVHFKHFAHCYKDRFVHDGWCKFWGFHGGDDTSSCLLGCDSVQCHGVTTQKISTWTVADLMMIVICVVVRLSEKSLWLFVRILSHIKKPKRSELV